MIHQVRAYIYECFRDTGQAPSIDAIASALDISPTAARASLEELASSRAIVLKPDSHDIWMAHPFSGIPTDYTATVAEQTWYANCGWDAVAILALLGDGTVTAIDPLSGKTNEWVVSDGNIDPPGVVHFLVPARQFWDDIGYT